MLGVIGLVFMAAFVLTAFSCIAQGNYAAAVISLVFAGFIFAWYQKRRSKKASPPEDFSVDENSKPRRSTWSQLKTWQKSVCIVAVVVLLSIGAVYSKGEEANKPTSITQPVDSPSSLPPEFSSTIPESPSSKESSDSVENQTEKMVWISDGGNKYHRKSTCSQMNNPTQVPLDTAIEQGYTPCKRCY